jgi:hypothetical protein
VYGKYNRKCKAHIEVLLHFHTRARVSLFFIRARVSRMRYQTPGSARPIGPGPLSPP